MNKLSMIIFMAFTDCGVFGHTVKVQTKVSNSFIFANLHKVK